MCNVFYIIKYIIIPYFNQLLILVFYYTVLTFVELFHFCFSINVIVMSTFRL